jgi:hypothetical protein
MLISHHQTAGENHSMKRADRSFEHVAEFKYLGTTVTDQNLTCEGIKSRLNLDNAYSHSVQNLLSSHLLSKDVKIELYKTIILALVLHGSDIWSLTLMEEPRLRAFDSRVLRRVFGPKKEEMVRCWRKFYDEEFHNVCSLPE